MFQQSVQRNYTTGFPGDVVRDGPQRAKPARIASANNGLSQNVISRAFGFNSDQSLPVVNGVVTQTLGAFDYDVVVGGKNFYGVLGHPKHYTLRGTQTGGTLAASITLPQYTEGEFFDMVTGMVAEIFNAGTTAQTVNWGDKLAYVPSDIATGDNPNNLPYGALVAYSGDTVPTGLVAIAGSKVVNPTALIASSPTVQASTYTIIQLTQ